VQFKTQTRHKCSEFIILEVTGMHWFLTGCAGSVSVVLGVDLLSNLGLVLIGSGAATMSGSGVVGFRLCSATLGSFHR